MSPSILHTAARVYEVACAISLEGGRAFDERMNVVAAERSSSIAHTGYCCSFLTVYFQTFLHIRTWRRCWTREGRLRTVTKHVCHKRTLNSSPIVTRMAATSHYNSPIMTAEPKAIRTWERGKRHGNIVAGN
jgi:hypothetical protein